MIKFPFFKKGVEESVNDKCPNCGEPAPILEMVQKIEEKFHEHSNEIFELMKSEVDDEDKVKIIKSSFKSKSIVKCPKCGTLYSYVKKEDV
jgi:predicted RNA-binding Zn-ribbon protein involved in translation (DUF1610 family)